MPPARFSDDAAVMPYDMLLMLILFSPLMPLSFLFIITMLMTFSLIFSFDFRRREYFRRRFPLPPFVIFFFFFFDFTLSIFADYD